MHGKGVKLLILFARKIGLILKRRIHPLPLISKGEKMPVKKK